MKKIPILISILLSILAIGATRYLDSDPGLLKEVQYATAIDTTLYVRTTGNDSNDCFTVSTACATPQEALDRLPKDVRHALVVDIGDGTFDGFDVEGFYLGRDGGTLLIEGKLGTYSPATGTASGTADGGSTAQCVDSGQSWTVDDLIGSFVLVNGEYRLVRNNDATTINLVGLLSATCSGKAYELVEPSTVINTDGPTGTSKPFPTRISVHDCFGTRKTVTLRNMKTTGGSVSMYIWYTYTPIITRLIFDGASVAGLYYQDVGGRSTGSEILSMGGNRGIWIGRTVGDFRGSEFQRIFSYNNSGHGIELNQVASFEVRYLYSDSNGQSGIVVITGVKIDFDVGLFTDSNTDHGLMIYNTLFVDIDDITADGNGGYGIYIDENTTGNRRAHTFLNASGAVVLSNNTGGGLIARNHSVVALDACTGSGNGGYGLELQTGSYATITSSTAVTGATADATINAGVTALTWATDFNDNGDIAVNLDNGTRIERQD